MFNSAYVGAGAQLAALKYCFFFSIPRFFEVNSAQADINTAGGGQFSLAPGFLIWPSMVLCKVSGMPLVYEITGVLNWQNTIDFGVLVRSHRSLLIF